MRFIKWLSAGVVMMLASGPVLANGVPGFFVVGNIGKARVESSAENFNDTATAYSLGGGYRFKGMLSVQAAYSDFGGASKNGAEVDASAFEIGAGISTGLTYGYDLTVRLDALVYDSDVNTGPTSQFSDSGIEPIVSVGIRRWYENGWEIRGEFRYAEIDFQDDGVFSDELDIQVFQFGVGYTFGTKKVEDDD